METPHLEELYNINIDVDRHKIDRQTGHRSILEPTYVLCKQMKKVGKIRDWTENKQNQLTKKGKSHLQQMTHIRNNKQLMSYKELKRKSSKGITVL